MAIMRTVETPEERRDRMRLETQLKRKQNADDDVAVDKMIRENIKLHGA